MAVNKEDALRRSRILVVGAILAVIGAVVPVLGMLWITWSLAVADEQASLKAVAERVLARAQRSKKQARSALTQLADNDAPPCSPVHIDRMRQVVFNTPAIEEVGYFESGFLKCTSWGRADGVIPASKPDFVSPDGLAVTLALQPALRGGATKLAFASGNYNVLVDPVRFVDVIAAPQVQLALTTRDGRQIASFNDPDPAAVKDFARNPRTAMDEETSSTAVPSRDWTAIAIEPRPEIFGTLRREQLMLLPIGGFIAALIVSIVVWFSRRRLSFRAELANAIHNREFAVHYQPIVDLQTQVCIGAEALLRWQRPDGSWIKPDLFIPVAEDTGMIRDLTEQVIDMVGRDLGSQLSRDRTLHVAINVPADLFENDGILHSLSRLTDQHGVSPSQIWLEATERSFMDYAAVNDTVSKAHALGYHVAMDDFGTGYSSLGHLQRIAFDALKIDKSFVDTIGIASAKRSVIDHIIELANALEVEAIAEGVEQRAQADYLRAKGVQFAQGWLFSRPLPPAEFLDFARQDR
jgi:sensor c-di-GMP phosphodiesterase-like protein